MEREKKTDKEKSHKGIWRWGCPGGVPGTNSGRPRDTWNIWAWCMCKSILKGPNVPRTDGRYHWTDGTCPRNRRDAHQGVSRQNSLCLLVFFFPNSETTQNLSESLRSVAPIPVCPLIFLRWISENKTNFQGFFLPQKLRSLESPFVVRSDSKHHRFAAISNRTIRIASPESAWIAVMSLGTPVCSQNVCA